MPLPVASSYAKPYLTVDEQLTLLRERGLDLGDESAASSALQSIGYYRLSGYWYPYRESKDPSTGRRPSTFLPNTTLEQVLEVYRFDELLRKEVLHATSRVEIALRFQIGHLLGRKGQFAHWHAEHLDPPWTAIGSQSVISNISRWLARRVLRQRTRDNSQSDHETWLDKQSRTEEVSSEAFIAHFNSNYGTPLPVWVATEVMSLGHLNRLLSGMKQGDRQEIAASFDVFLSNGNGDAAVFANWMEHLRQTRNYCAHHSRLWNRNHTAPLAVPQSAAELEHLKGELGTSRSASRIYASLALVSYLCARIDGTNEVRDRLVTLIEEFCKSRPYGLEAMGFPEGWKTLEIWSSAYSRDEARARQAAMLRGVELLPPGEAAALLTSVDQEGKRRSKLKYYRTKGAALSVPGMATHRYPAFQFDRSTGDLKPNVILANRRLLEGKFASESARWTALEWWTTPTDLLDGRSPQMALEHDLLTRSALDEMLDPRDDE